MSGVSGIGLLTIFGAGVISFLSPCVLPLVPGYVSYVAGDALTLSGQPVKAAGRAATQLLLRARLLDRLCDFGSERQFDRPTAACLPPGRKSGRRGRHPALRPLHDGDGE